MIGMKEHITDISKIDLHIHTCYSDGQARPEDIVRKAKALGYRMIAITDHDGTGGLKEAMETGNFVGLDVISGIELATETEEGIGLHILGYGFDPGNEHLRQVLAELAERRRRRNIKLIGVLNELGYDICLEELEKEQPGGFIGKPVIARALAAKGYVENYRDAFRDVRFFANPQAKAVKKEKLKAACAVSLINEAGGSAVLAHPIQTRHVGEPGSEEFYKNMNVIIRRLKEQGLKGLECYHPDQNEAQTRRFVQIAENLELYITRGSDFHGADYSDAEPTAAVRLL